MSRNKLRLVAYALLLTSCLALQGCWARGDTVAQEFLLYIDRVAGYSDSGLDGVKALYEEGKLTNKQAQHAKDALDRIVKADKLAFEAILAGADLTKRIEITGAKKALVESKLAGMKADALAVRENTGGSSRIELIISPLIDFLNNAADSLGKLKVKGTGTTAFNISNEVAAQVSNQAKRLNTTERDINAWLVN